ncbi:MAG: AAC(3) family N-acetyltransferase [Pelolinea sp.]|nr:AAC(3) family N-acetyltransferase [Pelolinea sp.]
MISYHDIATGLQDLGLNRSTPVLAHISLANLGEVKGGLNTVTGALLATVDNVMMPSFTFSTMVIPESGPEENLMVYGSGRETNLAAEVFSHDLPSDMPDSEASEALRGYPGVYRSGHPVFSFTGLGLDVALVNHPAEDPYAPISELRKLDGWVLLMGAEPSANFSVHYAEKLAGRKQFTHWALSAEGIHEIPHYPGCSDGFHKLHYYMQEELHTVRVADSYWHAMKVDTLLNVAVALIKEDAFALLCNNLNCPRCNLERASIKAQYSHQWRPESQT